MITTSVCRIEANFQSNRLLQVLLGTFLLIWVWGAFAPIDRFGWLLENLLVVLFMGFLGATYKRFPLSDLSYIFIFVYLALHTVGAHYTYSEVPFGFWLQDTFDLSRNHFDRIVHFSFGLFLAYPIREIFLRVVNTRGFWTYYLPLDVTLAFSGLFEIFEMIVCLLVNPDSGDAYLGTQGDIWDAQKDMGLATLGALITLFSIYMVRRKYYKGIPAEPA